MSADGRTCSLDDPRIVEALQYMVRVYDSLGGIEDVESFQSGFQADEFDPFLTGKVAMKIDGNWTLNNIADFAPGLRFGVAPAPAPAGRESITWSGGHSWAIPAGAGQPDMAFELIRFLNTDRIWDLRYRVEARYAASRGRSFVPVMSPMPHVNAAAFERHVRDSSDLPQRIKGGFLLGVAFPPRHTRWTTVVGRAQARLREGGAPHLLASSGAAARPGARAGRARPLARRHGLSPRRLGLAGGRYRHPRHHGTRDRALARRSARPAATGAA